MAVLDKIKNLLPGRKSGPVSSAGQLSGSFNKKTILVGALLIVSVLVMVSLFSYESRQAHQNKLYITIASEQQLISQQIVVNVLEASAGQDKAFAGPDHRPDIAPVPGSGYALGEDHCANSNQPANLAPR